MSSPAKAPRVQPPEVRREQLISATMKSIARNGLSGTTMAEVTKEAGLSLGIANLHFKSKEKLLIETLTHMTGEYHDGQQGTLMLVGDVKQSIYRWRGGLPEQFMDLINVKNPFYIEKQTINLPQNYRSKKEIVDFFLDQKITF